MSTVSGGILENFNRLIDRVVNRQVIPFLGAGVSISAEDPSGNGLHKTANMTKRVAEAIARNCASQRKNEEIKNRCSFCLINRQLFCHVKLEQDGQVQLCKHILDKPKSIKGCRCPEVKPKSYIECLNRINSQAATLTAICEMWEWSCRDEDKRYDLIENILHISEFRNLQPTTAHRYIAFLAREYLIDEVITTNYDTCMEKAYRESFDDAQESRAVVISSLSKYRDSGGRRFEARDGERRVNVLKIYKINGDAGEYSKLSNSEKEKERWAKSILLTEADLQNWRQRHWAKDLFRDRLRSRSILYSGFGSDEPQVRHTVLQICEEFAYGNNGASVAGASNDSEKNSISESGGRYETGEDMWWEKPNAPFLAVFENTLSFNQYQILQAYTSQQQLNNKSQVLGFIPNVFSGYDAKFFDPRSSKYQLSADVFWERVYQAAFIRLLNEAGSLESPAYQYLSGVNPSLRIILGELIHWVYFDAGLQSFDEENNVLDLLQIKDGFGHFVHVESGVNRNVRSTVLSQWIYAIRYGKLARTNGDEVHGVYMALADRQALIVTTLLLLYLLVGKRNTQGKFAPEFRERGQISYVEGLGLILKALPQWGLPWDICISHSDIALQLQTNYSLPEHVQAVPTSSLVQIVIGNGFSKPAKKQVYFWYKGTGETEGLGEDTQNVTTEKKIVTMIYQIPFADLFQDKNMRHDLDLPSCLKRFATILEYPAMVLDGQSLSMKSRFIEERG